MASQDQASACRVDSWERRLPPDAKRRDRGGCSGAATGAGANNLSILAGDLAWYILVGPHESFADGSSIAHQGCDRRIILLAIFESAHHGPVESRALGHVGDAYAALLSISLQSLQSLLNVEVHSHG